MSDLFAGVVQEPRTTTAGECALPILYRDASLTGVLLFADLAKARDATRDLAIEPWPILGRAVVALYAWEYRDSTVGVYNEVGLGIQARVTGKRPSLLKLARDMRDQESQGIWVMNLPVTTEAARAAGVELWGYPKYVSRIATDFMERSATARLGDEVRLHVGQLGGPPMAGLPLVTFTEREGRLIRTVIEVSYTARWGRDARVEILGDGPTARSLRALGLVGKKPLAAFRTDDFRAVLPAGVDVGPAR